MSLFVCWLWNGHGWHSGKRVMEYGPQHVNVLASMLRRHGGHDLVCVTDRPGAYDPAVEIIDMPRQIAAMPSYFPKLWAFSPEFGRAIGERFTSIDLDVAVTGDLGPLAARPSAFGIWNQAKGEHYNSSFFTLEPGARTEVWERFTVVDGLEAQRRTGRQTGDQCWIGQVLGPGQETYSEADGLIQYRPMTHRAAPVDGGLAYFMCGPYEPASEAEQSEWVRQAWR